MTEADVSPDAPGPWSGPLRIGLTGPIGCGKSTVAAFLARRGAIVIDADQVAREVTEPGEPALAAIAARFGSQVMQPDGRLDRAALGRLVFGDAAALADLEAIVHPAVRPRILGALDAAARTDAVAVVLEAIRLVDGGYSPMVDEVWVVECSPDVQRERLAARHVPAEDAARRVASQAELVDRARAAATRLIATDGSLELTERIVDAALTAALASRAGAS